MKIKIKYISLFIIYLTMVSLSVTATAQCIDGNCRNGHGTFTWPNGSKYIGFWQDSKRHGKGIHTFRNGALKTGIWENGIFIGTKAEWDAKKERDRIAKEERDGIAKEERDRIAIVFKQLVEDKNRIAASPARAACIKGNCTNGQGTYTWPNGDKYVGGFVKGNLAGVGTYTWASGATKTGVWENGDYFGTKAAWDAKEERERRDRIAEREKRARIAERERRARIAERERIAKEKHDRIYNACLLDKGANVSNNLILQALHKTCNSIADDPSWLEKLKYN